VVTRLLIVDDHRAIAEGLRALIDGAPDILVVGTAYDAPSARALISQFAPDVVLCDMRLGDPEEGLDLPEEGLDLLSAHVSDTAFIMLSAHTNPDYVVTAVVRGARGYLSKMASLSQIVDAVRVVASGGESFGDEAREAVGRSLPRPTRRSTAPCGCWHRAGPTRRSPAAAHRPSGPWRVRSGGCSSAMR